MSRPTRCSRAASTSSRRGSATRARARSSRTTASCASTPGRTRRATAPRSSPCSAFGTRTLWSASSTTPPPISSGRSSMTSSARTRTWSSAAPRSTARRRSPRPRVEACPETAVHGSGGTVSASIRRRRTRVRERPTRAAPHRRSDGAPAPMLRRHGPWVPRAGGPRARPPLRPAPAASALACRRQTCGTRAGPNSAAGRRGRRRSAYEAPPAAADGGTRLGGAESKRRRRPRLPARQSRVTLLAPGARRLQPADARAPAAVDVERAEQAERPRQLAPQLLPLVGRQAPLAAERRRDALGVAHLHLAVPGELPQVGARRGAQQLLVAQALGEPRDPLHGGAPIGARRSVLRRRLLAVAGAHLPEPPPGAFPRPGLGLHDATVLHHRGLPRPGRLHRPPQHQREALPAAELAQLRDGARHVPLPVLEQAEQGDQLAVLLEGAFLGAPREKLVHGVVLPHLQAELGDLA